MSTMTSTSTTKAPGRHSRRIDWASADWSATNGEIAAALGTTPKVVANVRSLRGLPFGSRGPGRSLTEEEVRDAHCRIRAGASASRVGRLLGVSPTTVFRALRDYYSEAALDAAYRCGADARQRERDAARPPTLEAAKLAHAERRLARLRRWQAYRLARLRGEIADPRPAPEPPRGRERAMAFVKSLEVGE